MGVGAGKFAVLVMNTFSGKDVMNIMYTMDNIMCTEHSKR